MFSVFSKSQDVNNIYRLPITRDYVRNWGIAQAVREIIQNALDSDSPFEWSFHRNITGTHRFEVISSNSSLSVQTLLLGSTSKAEQKNKIGSFGEGYKIALLVLARNDVKTCVLNRDKIWTPEFRPHPDFADSETLCIVERLNTKVEPGLRFVIDGLSNDQIEIIKGCALQFQKDIGEVKNTQFGQILLERAGELYVNGLFICRDERYKFGYNIKPEHISLERDRQTVSSWELGKITVQMWFDTKDYDKIAELIEDQAEDMYHAQFNHNELVKEACWRLFQKKYPGGIPAKNQEELKQLIEKGFQKVVVVGGGFYSGVTSSKNFKSAVTVPTLGPVGYLETFFENNRGYMRRQAIVEFKQLIERARKEKWQRG